MVLSNSTLSFLFLSWNLSFSELFPLFLLLGGDKKESKKEVDFFLYFVQLVSFPFFFFLLLLLHHPHFPFCLFLCVSWSKKKARKKDGSYGIHNSTVFALDNQCTR